ncbi:unnamed protein product [Ascophyllum nodosum]
MASNGQSPKTEKNLGSYYRRPSAAIEQGGGFFVPGLEGFRWSVRHHSSGPKT